MQTANDIRHPAHVEAIAFAMLDELSVFRRFRGFTEHMDGVRARPLCSVKPEPWRVDA